MSCHNQPRSFFSSAFKVGLWLVRILYEAYGFSSWICHTMWVAGSWCDMVYDLCIYTICYQPLSPNAPVAWSHPPRGKINGPLGGPRRRSAALGELCDGTANDVRTLGCPSVCPRQPSDEKSYDESAALGAPSCGSRRPFRLALESPSAVARQVPPMTSNTGQYPSPSPPPPLQEKSMSKAM